MRAPLPFLLLGAAALLLPSLHASEGSAYAPWYHQANDEGGGDCVVESHDPLFNGAAVALLERLRDQFLPAAAPGAPLAGPVTRLLLRVETAVPGAAPQPPALTARRYREGGKDHVDFQVTVSPGPGVSGEAWQRLAVEALLRRRALAHGAPPPEVGASLAPIPRWIVEGAFQSTVVQGEESASLLHPASLSFQEKRGDLYGKIARRAGFLHTTPSVAQVAGWGEICADPIFGAWQKAFCWYLSLFYQADPARSAALERWFDPDQLLLPGPDGKVSDAVQAQWAAFQRTIGAGMGDVLYSGERSAGELAAAQTVLLPGAAEGTPPRPPLVVPWLQLPEVIAKGYPEFPGAVQAKISALQLLEMKSNFAWRPVVALYRDALSVLVFEYPEGSPGDEAWQKKLRAWNPEKRVEEFRRRLALADQAALRLTSLNQQVADYLNWFEVTRKTRDGRSPFADYFDLNGQFDFLAGNGRAGGGAGAGAAN